jgi:hypothetical protein
VSEPDRTIGSAYILALHMLSGDMGGIFAWLHIAQAYLPCAHWFFWADQPLIKQKCPTGKIWGTMGERWGVSGAWAQFILIFGTK